MGKDVTYIPWRDELSHPTKPCGALPRTSADQDQIPFTSAEPRGLHDIFTDYLDTLDSEWASREEFAALVENIPETFEDHEIPDGIDPTSFRNAMKSPQRHLWIAACLAELDSIDEHEVKELVPRSQVPKGRRVMKGKWVLTIKRDAIGKPTRYKARYVLCGYDQVEGRDYFHTTSPTARMESSRVLLHIAATNDWDARQFDVKTAFLHGVLGDDEKQYMEQPEGFKVPGKEDWVWLVKKGLYGMKQAG